MSLLMALLVAALAGAALAAAPSGAYDPPAPAPPPQAGSPAASPPHAARTAALRGRNAALRAQIRKERRAARRRIARVRTRADRRVRRAAAASPAGIESEQAVRLAAVAYGLPEERMLRIARCESGLDPSASAGPYLGLFQFGTPLWGTTPYTRWGRDDPQAAALAAAWAFARGMDGHWPVCGRR